MADNLEVTPGSGVTMAADDIGGVKYPRSKLVHGVDGVNDGDVSRTNPFPVGEFLKVGVSANFTRPANTTTYAALDLVANSTTAGSVTPMTFAAARANDVPGQVVRGVLHKSTTQTASAIFRLHLFSASPSVSNGDNGAFSTTVATNYLGCLEGTCFLVSASGTTAILSPVYGSTIPFAPADGTQNIFGLLEVRGAYAPGSAEVFTITLEVM